LDTHPGAFGLTYENWKLHTYELDELCKVYCITLSVVKETKKKLEQLQELTKDIPFDQQEYDKFKAMIMDDIKLDPEYKAVFDEFKDLTAETQKLKNMMGDQVFADLENQRKLQDLFEL
jgi:uncharacterized membrane-anchored protein YjiN (DUF445 family)